MAWGNRTYEEICEAQRVLDLRRIAEWEAARPERETREAAEKAALEKAESHGLTRAVRTLRKLAEVARKEDLAWACTRDDIHGFSQGMQKALDVLEDMAWKETKRRLERNQSK